MSDPVTELTAASRRPRPRCARTRARRRPRSASSGPRSPSSATTRPTPRCCWRRSWASSRGRSPSGSPSSSRPSSATARSRRGRRPRVPQPVPRRRLVPAAPPTALAAAEELGGSEIGDRAERVLVEFVSANPTGPLTAASGRHAAYGDSVARVLEVTGHAVGREYYVNDTRRPDRALRRVDRGADARRAGARGRLRGRLHGRARRAARRARALGPDDLELLAERGTELMREHAERTLRRYGVEFDSWFSERASSAAGRASGRSRICARRDTSTRARARSGCGRRASATTRTASSSAPTAAHLLPHRHRLPPRQARATRRPPDRRARRRSPRLRRPAEGAACRRSGSTPTGSRSR